MGISIPRKDGLYIETGPWALLRPPRIFEPPGETSSNVILKKFMLIQRKLFLQNGQKPEFWSILALFEWKTVQKYDPRGPGLHTTESTSDIHLSIKFHGHTKNIYEKITWILTYFGPFRGPKRPEIWSLGPIVYTHLKSTFDMPVNQVSWLHRAKLGENGKNELMLIYFGPLRGWQQVSWSHSKTFLRK